MSIATDNFRFTYTMQVRYSDMDMLGHANNAVYLTYLELARLEYFKEVSARRWEEVALVLAHAELDFKIPLTPGIVPLVHMRTTKLGNTSLTMENLITDTAGQRVHFSATTVMVAIDTRTGRPTPIPDDEKRKVITYEPALG